MLIALSCTFGVALPYTSGLSVLLVRFCARSSYAAELFIMPRSSFKSLFLTTLGSSTYLSIALVS